MSDTFWSRFTVIVTALIAILAMTVVILATVVVMSKSNDQPLSRCDHGNRVYQQGVVAQDPSCGTT